MSVTLGHAKRRSEESDDTVIKKRKYERQDGVRVLYYLQQKQRELYEILGGDIEDDERSKQLVLILKSFFERSNENPTASILSNVEECYEECDPEKFMELTSFPSQFVRGMITSMELRSNPDDILLYGEKKLTFEQLTLCWLVMMRTGEINGMVQNGEYFTKGEVKHLFINFTDRFVDIFGDRMLVRRPTQGAIETIERQYRRRGWPGCIGFLQKFNVKRRIPTVLGGAYSNDMETLYCETWSDLNGICWAWNTISRSKSMLEEESQSAMARAIRNGEVVHRARTEYKVTCGGRLRKNFYFLTFGKYPEWSMFVDRSSANVCDELTEKSEGGNGNNERYYEQLVGTYKILESGQLEVDNETFERVVRAACILRNWSVHSDELPRYERRFNQVIELAESYRSSCNIESSPQLSISTLNGRIERQELINEIACRNRDEPK